MKSATRVTSKGQVVIPKPVREQLRWASGTQLAVEIMDGGAVRLTLLEAEDAIDTLYGCLGGSSQLHNQLKLLIAQGAVEVVPGTRERNRYYRVTSEERLREFAPAPAPLVDNGSPRAPGVAAERLGIEAGIQNLSEKLEHIDTKLADLLAALS